jgi:glutamate formiminotransferase/formiminotetrahydrofolate cyclodeaminase
VDAGVDANRTVFTFVGPPEAVGDAAISLGHAVATVVDMRRHRGAHPRLGALDVCPFVPIRGVSLERCARLSRRVGATLAHDLGLPVYLYEAAAFDATRKDLPLLRRGQFERLDEKLREARFVPDFGPRVRHPTMGAAIVGARPFLIAWNVSLDTSNVDVARAIAARVRTSGGTALVGTQALQHPGLLPAVRAIGWLLPSYGRAQVSLNLLDFTVTPMHVAWRAVCEQAQAHGAQVTGSELVGLVPLAALREAGRAALGAAEQDISDAALVASAVRALRLDALAPFNPARRVLEWAMGENR